MQYKIMRKIFALIYPERCAACDKLITEPYFCNECKDKIKTIAVKTCLKCGLPTKLCNCSTRFCYFKWCSSPFENKDEVRVAFYSFKFKGNRSIAPFFAEKMACLAKEKYSEIPFDLVTSVPCHYKTKAKFGFDRVGYLARKTAKLLKFPYKNCLKQPKPSVNQHKAASIDERFKNIRNKYRVKRGFNVTGKTVLLIDDIKTTGATLSECARELRLSGAKEVYVLTALITYPKPKENYKPKMTLSEKIELSKK